MPGWLARVAAFLVAAVASFAAALPASAEKRIALVVGNGGYDNLTRLNNPGNDARAIAALLEANGIKATLKLDLTHAELLVALSDFEVSARGADLALLYYAGHGVHLAGKDVLLPRDVAQKCGAMAEEEALKGTVFVDKAIDAMKAARNRVVILDACRTSTFPSCPPKRGAEGGGFRGLGRIEAKGTLIATSVAPGGLADDGVPGTHSPYATRLLKLLKDRPRSYFHEVLIEVNREMAAAGGADGQSGDLYFAGGVPPVACLATAGCGAAQTVAAAPAPPPGPSAADAELARLKAENEELKRKQQANLAPKPEPAVRPAPAPEPPPASTSDMAPGTVLRDCPECPEMVVVPAGSFTMGSPASEGDRSDDEGPQRKVTIAKPFAVGKFEVTFAEWDACMAAGGCKHGSGDAGWGRGKRPVIDVSWDDAKQYAAWLSQKSGKSYRLLTEAEWEYAARAGTTTPFSTGKTISTDQANFDGNGTYGGSSKGEYREKTVEVGSFRANAFGLHDMHGNVWEWVEDCWHVSYQGALRNGSAWITACTDSSRRVLRGGSWYDDPRLLRSADRYGYATGYRNSHVGFRVGRTLD